MPMLSHWRRTYTLNHWSHRLTVMSRMPPAPAPNNLRLYPAAACLSRPSVHHISAPSSIFGVSHYFAPVVAPAASHGRHPPRCVRD